MLRNLILILFVVALTACNSASDLRVETHKEIVSHSAISSPQKKIQPKQKIPTQQKKSPEKINLMHQVKKGETLFSIAWRYGKDYRALAQANHIDEPFAIYADQQLIIEDAPTKDNKPIESTRDEKEEAHHKVIQKKERQGIKNPVEQGGLTASKVVVAKSIEQPAQHKSTAGWIWPAQGKVIKTFSVQGASVNGAAVNKGIDIAGHSGAPVKAAAAGQVVYSGHGLAGYGNLVILKHDDNLLSAYAHNRRLLVREGDAVKAGQKIAEIGSTGAAVSALHFEIRRAGQPINPLDLLPSQKVRSTGE